MPKFYKILLLVLIIGNIIESSAQGLRFLNPTDSIDGRTSYVVFKGKRPVFTQQLNISFDLQIPRVDEVGYLLHLIDEKRGVNYNLFYDGRGHDWFEFNEEGKTTLFRSHFDKKALLDKGWVKFSLCLDLDRKKIVMTIDGKQTQAQVDNLPAVLSPLIVFGRYDYLIEVPSATIKNLHIQGGGATDYFFPLSQSRSNDVYDQAQRKVGHVDNPYWVINDSYHWQKLVSMHFSNNAGANFHPKRHLFYGYTRDTLFIYNADNHDILYRAFSAACPVDINLGMNFIDTRSDRLYTYEVFKYDRPEDRPRDEPSIASLDLNTFEWTPESYDQLPTQLHHHGNILDTLRNRFCIFGGFGSMLYFRNLNIYDIKEHRWEEAKTLKTCTPRYFTSLGIDSQCRYAYIFGGMGNESGNQSVGRRYLYDLYQVDLENYSTKLLWSLERGKQQNTVPVRNMFIMGNYFYTLCYPEALSESYLRLCRYSLTDGNMEMLGDSIPIQSDKIATNANIYYDPIVDKFYVCVQEFTDDIASTITLYSIQLPVLSDAEFAKVSKLPIDTKLVYIGITLFAMFAAALFYLYYRRCKQKKLVRYNEKLDVQVAESRANAIYLFGNFTAFDRKNKDISYLFTDKLRELTCLLFWYNKRGGISSKLIGTMLWGDKPADKVKNSRSVIMNHLRKVLEEIDGIELAYVDGFYQFIIKKPFYCDYLDYEHQVMTETYTEQSLLSILRRGKFLQSQNMPTLDQFKSETERVMSPIILRLMKRTYANSELRLTLYLAEVMLYIDPYHIEAFSYQMKALKRLGKVYEAQDISRAFHEEYIKAFGEDFTNS